MRVVFVVAGVAWLSLSGSVFAQGDSGSSCAPHGVAPLTFTSPAKDYAAYPKHSLDENGVLLFDYGAAYNNLGKHHDPYFISTYALALWRDWISTNCQDDGLKKAFLNQARWLAENAEMRGDLAVWSHPYENNYYHLEPGWISGIGQSRIASVLYRAYSLTREERLSALSEGAMLTYLRPLTEGGVVSLDGEVVWIEEAPDPKGRSYKVLNGHVTVLAGVYDLFKMTQDARWKSVFDGGVAAVRRDVPKFEAGFTSLYSLDSPTDLRPVAPLHDYNVLHVSQLLWLYDMTGEAIFMRWASHFQSYELNTDRYSAERSINAETNGPVNAGALYYSNYWSTGTYPTWLEVEMAAPQAISSIALDGYTLNTSPKDFDVEVTTGTGDKRTVVWTASIAGNEKKNIDIALPKGTVAQGVKVKFHKAINDEVLAVTALMPVRADFTYAPISNDCNYRPNSADKPMRYNVDRVFDHDEASAMVIHCPGYIMFPVPEGAREFSIVGTGAQSPSIAFRVSSDLVEWSTAAKASAWDVFAIPDQAKFVKLDFDDTLHTIQEIVMR